MDLSLGHFADVVGRRVRRLQEVRGSGQIKIQSTPRFFFPHCPQVSCSLKEMTQESGQPTHLGDVHCTVQIINNILLSVDVFL